MHTDDRIHRILIDAMMAEHTGHLDLAEYLLRVAADLHVATFVGKSSYFGDFVSSVVGQRTL